MYCPSCGVQNGDNSMFCQGCGGQLGGAPAQPAASSQVVGAPVPQSLYSAVKGYDGTVESNPVAGAAYQAPTPIYGEGCLSAAWRDVKESPHWVRRLLLLGLLDIVPILNFVVSGYAVQWARDLVGGRRESMPESFFENGTFFTGFKTLCLVLILTCIASIVGVMTFGIGFIFVYPFIYACVMRMAIIGRFGAGFQFSKVWVAYKRALGSLFGATYVPGIVACLAVAIVEGMGFGIMLLATSGGMSLYAFASRATANFASYGAAAIIASVVVNLLISLVTVVAVSAASVVTYRAVGHWVARFAPEWEVEARGGFSTNPNANAPYQGYQHTGQDYRMPSEPVYIPVDPNPGKPSAYAPNMPIYDDPRQEGFQSVGAYVVPTISQQAEPGSTPSPERQSAVGRDSGTTRLDQSQASLDSQTVLVLTRADGRTYIIEAFPATIGKGSAANVRIEDNDAISRVHVRIAKTGTSFIVEDLGATNKTYVNGDYLEEGELVLLGDGDELRLADEAFRISFR